MAQPKRKSNIDMAFNMGVDEHIAQKVSRCGEDIGDADANAGAGGIGSIEAPASPCPARLLEIAAGSGTAEDVAGVLSEYGPFGDTTVAFAIAVSRGQTQMAEMLGTQGNEMVKAVGNNVLGDYGDFMVCGGSIALSGFAGHPRFPNDFFQIEVDGGNCASIVELADKGFFGSGVLTSIVSSCLYQVGRYGKELRVNEEYYLAQGTGKYAEEDLAAWRTRESVYMKAAEELCSKHGEVLDVARIMVGKVDIFAYNRVTEFLCRHFPQGISRAWVPSRWRFEEKPLSSRELANLKTVFPYLDPNDVPRQEALMRCLAINGMTDELRIMQNWPDVFSEDNVERCISLASQNRHPDAAAFLLDCKTEMQPEGDSDSLFL